MLLNLILGPVSFSLNSFSREWAMDTKQKLSRTSFIAFVLIVFCLAGCQSQPNKYLLSDLRFSTVDIDTSESDTFVDLEAFGDAVGDKRIVLLDELTHGDGNVFSLKARLVKYLHQKKGFDVLVLESGIFDVNQIWTNQNKTVAEQAPGNIFYMYANSDEFQPLFQYIEQQRQTDAPLELAGFDSRLSGNLSKTQLVKSFGEYLERKGLSIEEHERWQDISGLLDELLNGNVQEADELEKKQFFSSVQWLRQKLTSQTDPENMAPYDSAAYWLRITNSLTRMAEVAWGVRRFDEHGLEMAENVNWMLTQAYKEQKIIIWGQYIHLNKYGGFVESLNRPEKPLHLRQRVENMSSVLHKDWSNEMYVVHFSGIGGAYISFKDMSRVDFSTDPGDLLEEAVLQKAGAGPVFLDFTNADFSARRYKSLFVWGLGYKSYIPLADMKNHWDAAFFFDAIEPVHYRY